MKNEKRRKRNQSEATIRTAEITLHPQFFPLASILQTQHPALCLGWAHAGCRVFQSEQLQRNPR